MKNMHEKDDMTWDNRKLGASAKHVRKASAEREKALDKGLGLQTISIRLPRTLINDLKALAAEDGIGYQPYLRQALMRFVRQAQYARRDRTKREKHLRDAR